MHICTARCALVHAVDQRTQQHVHVYMCLNCPSRRLNSERAALRARRHMRTTDHE